VIYFVSLVDGINGHALDTAVFGVRDLPPSPGLQIFEYFLARETLDAWESRPVFSLEKLGQDFNQKITITCKQNDVFCVGNNECKLG
jgi:hypothetical protein